MSDMPTEIQGRPLHDLGGQRYWGHTYELLEPGERARLMVIRPTRFREGDYLAVPTVRGGERRSLYRITDVRTPPDPGDQHFIDAAHLRWGDVGVA